MEVIGSSEKEMASTLTKLRAFRLLHDFRSKRFDRLLGWTLFKQEKEQGKQRQRLREEGSGRQGEQKSGLVSSTKTGKRGRQDLREEASPPKRMKASGDAKTEVEEKRRIPRKTAVPEKPIQELLKAGSQKGRTEGRKQSDSGLRSNSNGVVSQEKSASRKTAGVQEETEKRVSPEAVRSAPTTLAAFQDKARSTEKDTTVRDLEEIFSALGMGPQMTDRAKDKAIIPPEAATARTSNLSFEVREDKNLRQATSNGIDRRPAKVRDCTPTSLQPAGTPPDAENLEPATVKAPKQTKDTPIRADDDEFGGAQIAPDVEAALRYLGTTFGDRPAETGSRKRKKKLRNLYVWRRFCQSWALWPSRNWYVNFTTRLAERFEAEAKKNGRGVPEGIDGWRVDQLRKHGRDHLADAALGNRSRGMLDANSGGEQTRGKQAKRQRREREKAAEDLNESAVQMQHGGASEKDVSHEAGKEGAEGLLVQQNQEGERTNREASSSYVEDLRMIRKHLSTEISEDVGGSHSKTGSLEPGSVGLENRSPEPKKSRGARNEGPKNGVERTKSRGGIADLMRVASAVRSFPPGVEEALDQLGRMTLKSSRPLRPASIRPLSPEESARVSAAFQRFLTRDTADEAIATLGPHVVSAKELKVLNGASWLDDQVINFYLELIQRRNAAHRSSGRAVPRMHIFNSFFYTKLVNGGYNYAGVRRWTKKVDIFEQDVIIAPINLNNSHWALASVNMKGKCVEFYDSMSGLVENGRAKIILQTILRYLEDESQDKKQRPLDHRDQWTVKQTLQRVPQQGDGGSCGVFMCAYADLLAQGATPPFAFGQANVPTMRRAMAADILAGTLKGA